MAGVRPELIFVAGPQKHERAVLMNNEVVAGRSAQADIHLREPYASRQHMKFTFTRDGWIVESLSDRRIQINGKAFKPGKQILLASGDVVACGQETEMLFVDANDDPAEVLGAYREAHPEAFAQPVPVASPAASAGEAGDDGPPTAPVPTEPEPETFSFEPEQRERHTEAEDAGPTEAEQKEKKQKDRTRLYLIAFGAYAVLMLIVIIFLVNPKDDDDTGGRPEAPPMLTQSEVEDALTASLSRSSNSVAAQQKLQQARQYYVQRTMSKANRYKAIKNYRLHLAFRRATERVFLPKDEADFKDAVTELTDIIMSHYREAFRLEQAGKWSRALREFNNVLYYLPPDVVDDDPEVQETIVKNIRDHATYVSNRMGPDED